MKKREEEKPSYVKLFIGAFMLMAVFFIIVATHLTLSVDTTIGENDEGDIKESGLGVKHLIDSRLRLIQMEDSGNLSIKEEKKTTIDSFEKTIEPDKEETYKGQYQHSYGYNQTQQTQPYSQTYTTTQKSATVPVSAPKPTTTAVKPPVPQTVHPVAPAVKPTAPSVPATPRATVPSYQVQKNFAPTGMN